VAEAVSRALSKEYLKRFGRILHHNTDQVELVGGESAPIFGGGKEYLKRFGRILHHNTDQVELVGGESAPIFGGGEVIRPMYLLLSGRATTYVDDEKVPVGRIALDAAREYLT